MCATEGGRIVPLASQHDTFASGQPSPFHGSRQTGKRLASPRTLTEARPDARPAGRTDADPLSSSLLRPTTLGEACARLCGR